MKEFSTFSRSPNVKSHHQIQLDFIHRTPFFAGALQLSWVGYSQLIHSPIDNAEENIKLNKVKVSKKANPLKSKIIKKNKQTNK